MFHNKKGSAYNTSADGGVLYQDAPANTLLNDVFCYFVHNLPKFSENASIVVPYSITSATYIPAHVGTTYPAHLGPPDSMAGVDAAPPLEEAGGVNSAGTRVGACPTA